MQSQAVTAQIAHAAIDGAVRLPETSVETSTNSAHPLKDLRQHVKELRQLQARLSFFMGEIETLIPRH